MTLVRECPIDSDEDPNRPHDQLRCPRSGKTIGLFVRRLDEIIGQHPHENALAGQVNWL